MLLKTKEEFFAVRNIEEIAKSPANKTVRFAFSKELLNYCQKEQVRCAVEVESITQAIYANHYGATYLIASKKIAPAIQKIADDYLFDTKVLTQIRFEWEMEVLAQEGIDGVIIEAL
jgi:hypothetical protein